MYPRRARDPLSGSSGDRLLAAGQSASSWRPSDRVASMNSSIIS
jgi:hypothetical protein